MQVEVAEGHALLDAHVDRLDLVVEAPLAGSPRAPRSLDPRAPTPGAGRRSTGASRPPCPGREAAACASNASTVSQCTRSQIMAGACARTCHLVEAAHHQVRHLAADVMGRGDDGLVHHDGYPTATRRSTAEQHGGRRAALLGHDVARRCGPRPTTARAASRRRGRTRPGRRRSAGSAGRRHGRAGSAVLISSMEPRHTATVMSTRESSQDSPASRTATVGSSSR